ncbi:MAG: DUF3592 domain-containing protein [Flavobacteriaceae bacterium]
MISYVYWGLLFMGLTLVSFAIYQYNKTQRLLTSGIRTTATVVELIEVSDDDGVTYKPVFEFTDRNKIKQRFKSDVSSKPAAYRLQQRVKIVYNPIDLSEIKVISYWGLYRWTVILLCIAAPLIIIGGGYLMYIRA